MGAVPIMTAATLVGALALGQVFVKLHQRDTADRAKHERLAFQQRYDARSLGTERTARKTGLEKRSRDQRAKRRCERLLRTEIRRLRERKRRSVTAGDARRLVSRLPSRCKRMMARR